VELDGGRKSQTVLGEDPAPELPVMILDEDVPKGRWIWI
jgi:hypothetical protein